MVVTAESIVRRKIREMPCYHCSLMREGESPSVEVYETPDKTSGKVVIIEYRCVSVIIAALLWDLIVNWKV